MNKPMFSIIVPAHNSAEYIGQCLNSINNQTYQDFELIIVCDACTDGTEELVRGWFPDKVITTNFGMDGLARNAGIDAAEGEWILFLDDDDWWIHEYVLDNIKTVADAFPDQVDMIAFDFIWKGRGYVRNIRADRLNIAVWSKAFRRDFVGGIRFPAIPFTSDRGFMDEICAKKARTYCTGQLMYYYNYMRKGSQTEQHSGGGA
jgi:glycosyltransferase involved in cell wall biosynthesis